ncbi:VHS-domain-containing protein [Tothia fuscella]|uniref:VHS-domain-containing protein n=1 Tax=Tothia fuscella TaxID=1048955 RepID=A0A9P4NY28_9PEZI|nr:VHS-domain-containing protein [Tothia fuscella]
MAARDRWSGYGEPVQTPLQRYILNACDPQNFEPNLALNLEIADLINAKKGNSPREAAVAIVNYVNHRNPNVSMLALNLLDICVKNCGYPFHLQISTKEFLNELVRRFPERPPVHPTRAQMKILELIEEWRSTICMTSRYKEDLGFIRDMHRLLSYKGYQFPEVRREDAAVLSPSDNLRSADEMEEEERAAQSAKLQELIRRGGPHDLQEANKLMKVMAGYDTRNKTDWRAKAAEEVASIQQKAKLLEDMLQKHQRGDKIKEGDVFEELANALMSAHPKIQRMCEEESDDHEAVAKLFEINDSINRTVERYRLIKKGDLEGASKIPKGTLGTSGAGVVKGANNELSLIDLGGPEDSEPVATPAISSSSSSKAQPAPKGNALEDDLLGLSIGGDSYGQGGAVAFDLGSAAGASNGSYGTQSPPPQHLSNAQITSMFASQSQQPSQPSTFNSLAGFSSNPTSRPQSTTTFSTQPIPAAPKPDPFASLGTAPRANTPRNASPFQFQQSISQPPTAPPAAAQSQNNTDLLGAFTSPVPPPTQRAAPPPPPSDDEWTFSSALPPPSSTNTITLTQSPLLIKWTLTRPPTTPTEIEITSRISNTAPSRITELTFQVAVTKSYSLKLEPQSGRDLAPGQVEGVTQVIRLLGVDVGQGGNVRIRWKLGCVVDGQRRDEQGEVGGLGIA